MCPYFAMFPEEYVARQLLAFTRPGDLVLDPFCGRGTTILESTLHSRRAIGTDVNLVAACVSGAKAEVPALDEVLARIDHLETHFVAGGLSVPDGEFFEYCFHSETLGELLFLRAELRWREDPIDRFVAAVALGALHGEAHRSPNYFSNRMPRTISTKPEYSVRWWKERNLAPDRRRVFPILRALSRARLSILAPSGLAKVALEDARNCAEVFSEHEGEVRLMVTSPPYLDTTDYSEDQWLRIWFLGGPERPKRKMSLDDRHTNKENYWDFLSEVWAGTERLLGSEATIAIRIGGKKLDVDEISNGLSMSLKKGLSRGFHLLDAPNTSEIKNGQLNSFRPGALGKRHEHDFVFRLH
nr:DNA methyltransferase [Mesorhizobium sp.]